MTGRTIGWMATVDPDDDGIQRYVVRRYAHDTQRHERRHQVVAAFDNEQEFLRLFETLAGDLERRRHAGESIDPAEHYNGVTLEPGYRRRQRDGRTLREAIRRRVSISDSSWTGSTCRETCSSYVRIRRTDSSQPPSAAFVDRAGIAWCRQPVVSRLRQRARSD